jgi:hypothetical protein
MNMHDVVALLEGVHTKHFESGHPLLLRGDQSGNVVMTYPDAREVEFADRDGGAFAILPLWPDPSTVLHALDFDAA